MQTPEKEGILASQPEMDPALLRAYQATIAERRRWEASVQQVVQALIGGSDAVTLDAIPTAAEIRAQMRQHVPHTVRLSEQIIREREEGL